VRNLQFSHRETKENCRFLGSKDPRNDKVLVVLTFKGDGRCYISRMTETDQISEELKLAFEGEPWHGPSLMEILDGVDAKTAVARPIPAAHSIWELALHIAAWEWAIRTRIVEGRALELSDEKNFPQITDAREDAWRKAIGELRKNHAELIKTVSELSEKQLSKQVPGKDYDVRFMLHGAAQHAAYHGGQIALLKKHSALSIQPGHKQ